MNHATAAEGTPGVGSQLPVASSSCGSSKASGLHASRLIGQGGRSPRCHLLPLWSIVVPEHVQLPVPAVVADERSQLPPVLAMFMATREGVVLPGVARSGRLCHVWADVMCCAVTANRSSTAARNRIMARLGGSDDRAARRVTPSSRLATLGASAARRSAEWK